MPVPATNGAIPKLTQARCGVGGSEPMEGSLVLMWRVSGDIQPHRDARAELPQRHSGRRAREPRTPRPEELSHYFASVGKAAETAELSVAVLDLDLKQTGA